MPNSISPAAIALSTAGRYVDRLRAVTREQIRDVARKYLPLTDYACITFAPGKP